MRRQKDRFGFTVVEVLVTIAIVGTLAAIVLPAVHTARESARRNVCLQRMGQLVLAAESHQAAHGVYPPGRFLGKYSSGRDRRHGVGWR